MTLTINVTEHRRANKNNGHSGKTLATLGTQDSTRRQTKQSKKTSLCANKHK